MRSNNESIIAHVAICNAMSELQRYLTLPWPNGNDNGHPKLLFLTDLPDEEAKALVQSGDMQVAVLNSAWLADFITNKLHEKAVGAKL